MVMFEWEELLDEHIILFVDRELHRVTELLSFVTKPGITGRRGT